MVGGSAKKLGDRDVQGLAESLRELVGMASDCPVAEIRGTDVIESIEHLALEVASLIDEYTGRSFMEHLGKAQIAACQAMVKDLYEGLRTKIIARTANHVKEMQENAKRRDADKLVKDIREWLSAPNTSVNHKSARDICVEGTGSWFAKDEQFLVWLNKPGTTLWIEGGPGFGKTVLFSTTVDGVRKHTGPRGSTCGCAYFYFDGREAGAALEKFETLLRSILAQLCFNQADIPDVMKRLYNVDGKDHPEPTLSQLRTTLEEVLKGFNEVYILIDALDECDLQVELLDWMDSLQLTPQGLHLLATSRPVRIIEERMPNSSHVCIPLTSDLLDNDIKTYVDGHVKASNDLKLLMTKEMKKKLRIRGDGMFRLVAFWINDLKHCFTAEDVTETLERLLTSLNDMYHSMVSRIHLQHLLYTQAIIQWLLFSVWQLTLEEIAVVPCFDFSNGRPVFNKNRCFGNPKAVLDVCGGLVVVSQGRFMLAHLTVKEFLLQQDTASHQ
ncbi:hypothetical protein PAXINDRAFT_21612 [Paxillus involutus ATCC 200175]|uniref:NACHT domain-containing protein n=1 Tax=Paxillus involutus ATCC 200175 TaxID=664439 RepID=A0A0C9T0U8_PAXIN|nr:hypothetical protein PAXINDRAFT_21612 [Paxillus involutus ATCC 200175]